MSLEAKRTTDLDIEHPDNAANIARMTISRVTVNILSNNESKVGADVASVVYFILVVERKIPIVLVSDAEHQVRVTVPESEEKVQSSQSTNNTARRETVKSEVHTDMQFDAWHYEHVRGELDREITAIAESDAEVVVVVVFTVNPSLS